jgi:hypothetical protein
MRYNFWNIAYRILLWILNCPARLVIIVGKILKHPFSRHPLLILLITAFLGAISFPISSRYSDLRNALLRRRDILNELADVSAKSNSLIRSLEQQNLQIWHRPLRQTELLEMEKDQQQSLNAFFESFDILEAHIAFNFSNDLVSEKLWKYKSFTAMTIDRIVDNKRPSIKRQNAGDIYRKTCMEYVNGIANEMSNELNPSMWNTMRKLFWPFKGSK